MIDPVAAVSANLSRVRERMARAAESAGRSPHDVTLVGVTKYVEATTAAILRDLGCRILGESRPQELWAKAESARLNDVEWHLIGHLQRNKVRRTLKWVSLIHSVDSERLLAAISAEALRQDLTIDVLLEVNCAGEAAKHGVLPDDLPKLLDAAAATPGVCVRGLMTMAPLAGGGSAAEASFGALRDLRDRLHTSVLPAIQLVELSMGMSRDFELAIRHGATMVRVGSALFEGLS